MTISSSAFHSNDTIPVKYGKSFDDINPPLAFLDTPPEAQELALIMDDPDALGGTFTHWVVYGIPATTLEIPEDSLPTGTVEGVNDYGQQGYGGPRPPSGTHRYVFKLFALSDQLKLQPGATSEELQEAMQDHILAEAELIGTYSAKERI